MRTLLDVGGVGWTRGLLGPVGGSVVLLWARLGSMLWAGIALVLCLLGSGEVGTCLSLMSLEDKSLTLKLGLLPLVTSDLFGERSLFL